MSTVRLVARPLLASSFIASGIDRLRHAEQTAVQLRPTLNKVGSLVPQAAPVTDNAKLVARIMGATQVGAGLLLGAGKFSRLAALALAGVSGFNALVEYKTADTSTKEARSARRNQLLKNVSLIGAVLLAAVDTNGRPGLAWRAGHLVQDTRKSARKQFKRADHAVRSVASDVTGS